jgi:hypothetical protein
MSHPYTLPVVGASLLLSVAAGIHLGESAIGLVNPLYFQGPAVHPRDRGVAIYESPLPARGPAYGELYGWEEGYAARAADCLDCEALAARDAYAYSAQVPYFGSGPEYRTQAEDRTEPGSQYAKVIVPPPEAPAVEDDELILRYSNYPVEVGQGMGGPEAPADEVVEPDQD